VTSGSEIVSVDTPLGPARFHVDGAEDQRAVLILGHGAGGGVNAMDLELLAHRLPEQGVTVLRFEQPWRSAGRKVAGRPPTLDEAWTPAVRWLRGQLDDAVPLYLGGRSAGARVACRTATELGAAGVVCLAFPLHLPGRPERSRAAELLAPSVPRLVLQGSRDTFGGTAEVAAAVAGPPGVRLVDLPGADHGYRLARGAAWSAADLRETLVAEVSRFLAGE